MDLDIQSKNSPNELEDQDCAVCLQKYHYPTRLPCGHVFCFLCVKGIAIQSKKCAMCRKQIPTDYLDNPVLLESLPPDEINTDCSNEEYQWYYEGRNGWWKYDDRSNAELESAFNNGDTECMLLLAGALYCVDFHNMLQLRRSDPTRRRRVRRDIPSLPSKGIAGIKKNENIQEPEAREQNENVTNSNDDSNDSNSIDNDETNEFIEQEEGTGNSVNEDLNALSEETIEVHNIVESLIDLTIANPAEESSSPDEVEISVQLD